MPPRWAYAWPDASSAALENWVVGAEAQYSWLASNNNNGVLFPGGTLVTSNNDQLGSVSGRLGYVWDREEDGLLGSAYYVNHPIVPLAKTVGYVNFDIQGANLLPSLRNVSFAVGAETGGPKFQSIFSMPFQRSVSGAIPKSSLPPGVARPWATKAGIFERSRLTPRVSSSFSKALASPLGVARLGEEQVRSDPLRRRVVAGEQTRRAGVTA